MVKSFNYMKIYIVSTSLLLTISSGAGTRFKAIKRHNYSGMILFQGFWCSGKSQVGSDTSEAMEEVLSVPQTAMLLMLLKTNLTETCRLSKSRNAFLCFLVFWSYNSRRTFWWAKHKAESGVWVLGVGCILICCGAKLQRMSHSAMIYFTLHPVQFKATRSKKRRRL